MQKKKKLLAETGNEATVLLVMKTIMNHHWLNIHQ